jgi:hypothetical protein
MFLFFFHICDVKILVIFSPKIAKLVEITLGKHIYPKFPRFFCQKKQKFTPKEKHGFEVRLGSGSNGELLQTQNYDDKQKNS